MAQNTDVLIIGGGAIGVACAYYLQQSGRQVTVLEKGELGGACSEGNAGLIVPSHVTPLAAPGVMSQGLRWMLDAKSPFYIRPRLNWELARWIWAFRGACSQRRMQAAIPVLHGLLQASYDHLLNLEERLQLGLVRKGMIITYAKEKGRKDCQNTALLAQGSGLEVESLDAMALRRLEPNVHSKAQGGIYFPQDAHLDPAVLVQKMAAAIEGQGVIFCRNAGVTEVEREGSKITRVHTAVQSYQAKEVILAGGAWSPDLVPGVRLPIQAGKGYSVTLPARGRIPKISLILAEEKVSVTPLGDKIRFGGTLELSGLDPTINRSRVSGILTQASDFLDDFDPNDASLKIWHGYRPCTPDGLPIIGRYPGLDNLLVAGGHAMVGISLAPITGAQIADVVMGRPPKLDLNPLLPDRFL